MNKKCNNNKKSSKKKVKKTQNKPIWVNLSNLRPGRDDGVTSSKAN
jgi:hypothetical protein